MIKMWYSIYVALISNNIVLINVDRMTNGTQGSSSHMPTPYTRGATDDAKGWTLPPKHARKLDRFLNKNSVHGTAISTKVKGATAPPDELFISRVDDDTTEADMAEYMCSILTKGSTCRKS